jgi:hypothetical protein
MRVSVYEYELTRGAERLEQQINYLIKPIESEEGRHVHDVQLAYPTHDWEVMLILVTNGRLPRRPDNPGVN